MDQNTSERILTRDCEAIRIPSGETFMITAGTPVMITQALGGSFTIATNFGLARITDQNADALGLEPNAAAAPVEAGVVDDVLVDEKAVWDQLKTCYDPEIPVNIVDLGLVYDCIVTPRPGQGSRVDVKMTLTAPGCGMGPTIAAEARQKVLGVAGVSEADVELVWDPAWNQAMISEAGKMKLGMI
jgi:probable FeS assembly SUF system protein SufT